jgi:hypothetical protein
MLLSPNLLVASLNNKQHNLESKGLENERLEG